METLPAVRNVSVMPVMTLLEAAERRNAIVEFTKALMVPGVDYGVIPGAGDKKVLFKPGAEKLTTLFGLSASFVTAKEVMDWTGADHGSEPFFYMQYKCQLSRGGDILGEGIGSCNSWEKKYRYRRADPVCPECGAAAIRRSRQEYGGGWYCNRNAGGCGAKWKEAPFDTNQSVYVRNPDIADQVNTIDKMAQKRALVAATLITINASEFFTQDLEDAHIDMPTIEEPIIEEPTRDEEIGDGLDVLQIEREIARRLTQMGVIQGDEAELISRTIGEVTLDHGNVIEDFRGWKLLPALWINKYVAILRERARVSKEDCQAYMRKHFKIDNPAKLRAQQQTQLINWLSVSVDERKPTPEPTREPLFPGEKGMNLAAEWLGNPQGVTEEPSDLALGPSSSA